MRGVQVSAGELASFCVCGRGPGGGGVFRGTGGAWWHGGSAALWCAVGALARVGPARPARRRCLGRCGRPQARKSPWPTKQYQQHQEHGTAPVHRAESGGLACARPRPARTVPVERVEREHGDEATTLLLERKHGRGPGRGAGWAVAAARSPCATTSRVHRRVVVRGGSWRCVLWRVLCGGGRGGG